MSPMIYEPMIYEREGNFSLLSISTLYNFEVIYHLMVSFVSHLTVSLTK